MDITTAPSPVTHVHDRDREHHSGHGRCHDGLSGKDAAFLAEGHIQARAVEDARGLGRIDRDLERDILDTRMSVKDSQIDLLKRICDGEHHCTEKVDGLGRHLLERILDGERRTGERFCEVKEKLRDEGDKTRDLIRDHLIKNLEDKVRDQHVDKKIECLQALILRLIPSGTPIAGCC